MEKQTHVISAAVGAISAEGIFGKKVLFSTLLHSALSCPFAVGQSSLEFYCYGEQSVSDATCLALET